MDSNAELEAVEVKIRMFLSPLAALLRSRKVMVALVSLLVMLFVAYEPRFEPFAVEMITLITAVALALVGSIAWEDTAAIKAAANESAGKTPAELAKETAVIVIDELIEQGKTPPEQG